jgi:hypothetical protein
MNLDNFKLADSPQTWILLGLSGTGKTCLAGDVKSMGGQRITTFNKWLLDNRFGDGVPSNLSLVKDSIMYLVHIHHWTQGLTFPEPLCIERCIIDQYFYLTQLAGYSQTKDEVKDMNHIIDLYLKYSTAFGKRELNIVDIWNLDRNWIKHNLDESESRRNFIPDEDTYLRVQGEYKDWYFSKLNEFTIPYKYYKIVVKDVLTDFTPEIRREWISKYIFNSKVKWSPN